MMNITNNEQMDRKQFLLVSGIAAAALLPGCKATNVSNDFNLGSGDTGMLNYIYVLKLLNTTFYNKVVAAFYTAATADEKEVFTDVQLHHQVQFDMLQHVLGTAAIATPEFDFSSVDFTSRSSVLTAAKTLQDLETAAANGAAKLMAGTENLMLLVKMASVNARHAAVMRDLIQPDSANFAGDDVVDGKGLGYSKDPAAILAIAQTFIKTTISAVNLPTT
ncbi:MAG: ferritin-like domain-containing protein [Chitinophagales bacterium]